MSRLDDLVSTALKNLPAKPADTASASEKKGYSEKVSNAIAPAFAAELRHRGLAGSRPTLPGDVGGSGAERRMAGAIGAKKVDVTWATEESGLLLALSIKSVNFRDGRSGNFQKNITNRRGDLLYEAVTLHRRFPYAVLGGFMFLDREAAHDDTTKRRSTFLNTEYRLRLFDGRNDPSGRDEQYERLYVVQLDANPFQPWWEVFRVGKVTEPTTFDVAFNDLLDLVAQRNPDFYDYVDGELKKA